MKRTVVVVGMLLSLAAGAHGADVNAEAPRFFPRGFLRGYVDFQLAPPHNEFDMGFCTLATDNPLPQHPTCTAYGRYAWSGYLEFQPIGRGPLRRLFLFIEPEIFGGVNIPQQSYTASGALILSELSIGAGVELPKGFELRFKNHQVHKLGKYRTPEGVATLRTDGPYGLYSTIGLRWNFGGWSSSGRRR